MHATPDSSGPSQSPLAAFHSCARLPYVSAQPTSKGGSGASAGQEKSWCLCGPGGSTFRRLSASRSDRFQPRGSQAPIWASPSTSRENGFADCWVCNQPLIVEADQSPPAPKKRCRALSGQVQRPFIRRIPGDCHSSRESRPARYGLPGSRGGQRRGQLGKPATPAHQAVQSLPTCCCGSLGTLKSTCSKCIPKYTNQRCGLNHMTPRCAY